MRRLRRLSFAAAVGFGLALCILSAAAPSALAAEPKFPPLTGRIVDQAELLSLPTRELLAATLAAHEQQTGEQVVIATIPSLQGFPIEEFGYRLGRSWGIGQKDRDTGAILLVAPAERAVRIEVGYGLEGRLTDAATRLIIERSILPAFRAGQFERGVVDGTTAILAALRGESPGGQATAAPAAETDTLDLPSVAFIILVIIFFALRFRYGGFLVLGGGTGIWRSGSSGGFSGGGGSFGGGGASGRW